eukprot:8618702-Pyramimonas_sp.AAC.1
MIFLASTSLATPSGILPILFLAMAQHNDAGALLGSTWHVAPLTSSPIVTLLKSSCRRKGGTAG